MIFGIKGVIGSGKDTVAKMIQYYYANKKYPNGFNGEMKKFDFFNQNIKTYIDVEKASGFEIRKFAYKLKQISALILNCTIEDLEDRDFKEQIMPEIYQLKAQNFLFEEDGYKDKTYRWFLQHFADHLKILLGKDYFVNELFSHYTPKKKESGFQRVVKQNGIPVDFQYEVEYPNWIISDLRFINEAKAIKDRNGIIIGLAGRGDETHNHISELELREIEPDFEIENNGSIEDLYRLVVLSMKAIGL